MRPEEEERILRYWEENRIWEKVREREGPEFYFCDGPPYATGDLHPGTAWNKCVKDAFIRFRRFQGYRVLDQPGYDTHGLPIEVKVEKKLGISSKKEIEELGIDRFIQECKGFVDSYIHLMTERFKRLGVSMDWENPYITYSDAYIEESWKTIKEAWEKGLLEEADYVVAYCPRCETTLANYELEYRDRTDPAIFVAFPSELGDLVVWTTTPWTLPANLAVAVASEEPYVIAEWEDRRIVVAKARLEEFPGARILREVPGRELVGKEYRMPLEDLVPPVRRRVISADFVSMDEGSGLVHVAPGHGEEDFKVGRKEGLPVFSPVDSQGRYTEEVKGLEGLPVLEANSHIISLLEQRGALLKKGKITHRYPHCWRCKTPLIFRATRQWFIKVSRLKEKMLAEVERTRWIPEFAKERMLNFVREAPDWCISRQRYWGIPLPIWRCQKCGKVRVIGSKEELGTNVELHRPFVDEVVLRCECGGEMRRVPDVLDVWFDSGNAVWASRPGEGRTVCDLIYEGQDQFRGWFYSLLGSGLIRSGRAPYRTVAVHGFFLNEKGEEMSKSLGNFIPVAEIVGRMGADPFRLFVLSMTFWEDLKFSWEEMKKAASDLRILENLCEYWRRFGEEKEGGQPEDRWLLSRLHEVYQAWYEAMDSNLVFKAVRSLRKFWVEDLSRFYLRGKKAKEKRVPLEFRRALEWTVRMLEPICPFTAERLYLEYFKTDALSVSLWKLEPPWPAEASGMAEIREIVEAVRRARERAGFPQRWPLPRVEIHGEFPREYQAFLLALLNAKELGEVEEGIEEPWSGGKVRIPRDLPPEALEEAKLRELLRRIQAMRKEAGLTEGEPALVWVEGFPEVEKFSSDIWARTSCRLSPGLSQGLERKWETRFGEWRILLARKGEP